MISDILEIANTLALEGFLVTTDIEKAFDSVNHSNCNKNIANSSKIRISWIKTILKNQESCIINVGKTTKYFKLERGQRSKA